MKRAGEVASALFDAQFMKKAQGYSKLFNSWVDITEKNGIASASAHSRIKELDKGILFIEMDHPGWKQILQTKQTKLLNDFRYRFPDMDISGIALVLGLSEGGAQETENSEERSGNREQGTGNEGTERREANQEEAVVSESALGGESEVSSAKGLDGIKDEEFRETLKRLGQNIAEREKS